MGFSKEEQSSSPGTIAIITIIATLLGLVFLGLILLLGVGFFLGRPVEEVASPTVQTITASALSRETETKAPVAEEETAVPRGETELVVRMDLEGKLTVENQELELESLEQLLAERQAQTEGLFTVHLQASSECPVKHLSAVTELCEKLEIKSLRVTAD